MVDLEITLSDHELERAFRLLGADPGFIDVMLNEMGDSAVDALQAPDPFTQGTATLGSSGWNVDTGNSKASFDYHLEGADIVITNDADYAVFVEEKYGQAAATLEANLPAIIEAGDAYVQRRLDEIR